jgi:hypothetical protein
MKRLPAGLFLAVLTSAAIAQQTQRPQIKATQTVSQEAVQESIAQRGAAPLQAAVKQQAYTAALDATAQINQGDLGAPVKITPRHLYVNSTTYAMVRRGTVAPQNGPTGVAHIFAKPAGSGDHPMLELNFRAAANKAYIVDCALARAAAVRMGIGGPEIRSVENHFVGAVAQASQARDVKLQLVSDGGFEFSECEIVPVNR